MFAIELDLYWVALFGLHSWLSPIALAHRYNCYYSFRFTGAHRFLHPIHPLQTEDVIARSLTYIAAARVHRICGSVCDLCARARHSINSACAIAAIGISALHTVYYINVVVVCVCVVRAFDVPSSALHILYNVVMESRLALSVLVSFDSHQFV